MEASARLNAEEKHRSTLESMWAGNLEQHASQRKFVEAELHNQLTYDRDIDDSVNGGANKAERQSLFSIMYILGMELTRQGMCDF